MDGPRPHRIPKEFAMFRRLTGRQITTMVVAVCLSVFEFPVGWFAAGLSKVRVDVSS
jgi:hypothetical protein